jgi:predicted DCC family thiol-disulfide oxidoreductase YuxK
VRFLLAIDREGVLRFAPLGGRSFLALVPESERPGLPDSLVLRSAQGRLLVRSAAVLECLRLVGGPGAPLAALAGLVPTRLADRLYDVLARARSRFLAAPRDACPAVDAPRRGRFLP